MQLLTTRQEKFVEHYVLHGNAADAAREAGYSKRTARQIAAENLTKPVIRAAIQVQQAAYAVGLQIAKEDVLAGILSAIQMARAQQNPGVMISGCVQLAKLCGFYEPEVHRVQIGDDGDRIKAKFAGMSDDELVALMAGKISLDVGSA